MIDEETCDNPECCASTGICGSITAGTGELSDYGYFEFPCYICPKRFEHLNEEESEQLELVLT
jgi:hypothetical protein